MDIERNGSQPSMKGPPEHPGQTLIVTHLAIQESLDGKNVAWLEEVADAQYEGRKS